MTFISTYSLGVKYLYQFNFEQLNILIVSTDLNQKKLFETIACADMRHEFKKKKEKFKNLSA
jgi:hypothetical protein